MIEQCRELLDFIAKYESRGNYNIVWGGIRKKHHPPKPLVEMTVREVLAWQDSIDPLYMSEAAGKYQIMEDTLRGLYKSAGVSLDDLYNEDTQDKLAVALLRRRGLDGFMSMEIDGNKFANSIAKEWASMPVVTDVKRGGKMIRRGSSYYSGDGLNAAHAPVGEFLDAVMSVRSTRPDPNPKTKPNGIAAIIAAILSIFARSK